MKYILAVGLIFSSLTVPQKTEVAVIDEPPIQIVYAEEVVEEVSTTTEPVIDDKPIPEPETIVPTSVACSCVKTARMHGVELPPGNAIDLKPNSDIPVEGQVIIMKYHSGGHVAVIREITEEGYWIVEGNYHRCKVSERFIPKTYPHIVGFWTEYTEGDILSK